MHVHTQVHAFSHVLRPPQVRMLAHCGTQMPFSLELDVYDFCSAALKSSLEAPRQGYKEAQDALARAKKLGKVRENVIC